MKWAKADEMKTTELDTTKLERYRDLIDDWPVFLESLQCPLPTTIWNNSLRVSPSRLNDLFIADGIYLEKTKWQDGVFRLPPRLKPGEQWQYWAGLYHVQEEAAMIPVHLLDPQPGERILDMCAAPGNKTAQISVLMQNRGTVLANDPYYDRVRAMRQIVERLGLINVSTVRYDGTGLPKSIGLFDRVLVDPPCSCEGTTRKNPEVLSWCDTDFIARKRQTQLALLRKAVQLCKPGGRIVYSTCTYAPEENEMVVNDLLQGRDGNYLQLLTATIPQFKTSPGLTVWQGQRLADSLAQTMRIWPHQNDTGGFFVAVLEKSINSPIPPGCETEIPLYRPSGTGFPLENSIHKCCERYGIDPAFFSDYTCFQQSQKGPYLVTADHRPPSAPAPDACGVMFLRTEGRYPKLRTGAVGQFNRFITRNYIELTATQQYAYLRREDLDVTAEQCRYCTGPGHVALRYKGFGLGLGFFDPDSETGLLKIRNYYPKGWALGSRNG